MGFADYCVKHQVKFRDNMPEDIRVLEEKIDELKDHPMGLQIAQGKCPFCIYDLGFKDGVKSSKL